MRERQFDPLEALSAPLTPVAPDPNFAASLRDRLTRALMSLQPEEESMPTPAVIHRVETYLSVADPRAAIDFYQAAFGARLVGEPIVMPDGSIGHSELAVGDSVIRVAGEQPAEGVRNPAALGGTTVQLYVTVDDADALVAQAQAAGAVVLRPAADAYGARMGKVRDPFGHNWFLVTRVATPRPAGDLGYFTLGVPDGRRAAMFWSSLFAWNLEEGPVGYHIANIDPPGGIHGGVGAPAVSLFFRVHDIELAAERVRSLGGRAGAVSQHPSGGNVDCVDDQGVPFQLWAPAPGY
ncbi:MAG: VOC family protein [Candidatus Dormibacteraeota bacterium]|nr:VOC family protein [Candidatus Dormibacteraeota bacterium]